MRTAPVINALVVFGAMLFLYLGYGYYIERSMEEACEDSQEFLSLLARESLCEILLKCGIRPEEITHNYIGPKITEIRGTKWDENPVALSQLEVMYFILGDYLEPDGCDLFTNVVRASQARAVMLYTAEFGKADRGYLSGEVGALAEKSRRIDHVSAPVSCGMEIENRLLEDMEPEYCRKLHTQNYRLVKGLEEQLENDDEVSMIYKAVLANCFADCINEEADCVERCWAGKLG